MHSDNDAIPTAAVISLFCGGFSNILVSLLTLKIFNAPFD